MTKAVYSFKLKLDTGEKMAKKAKSLTKMGSDFSAFIADPPISASLVVFALIALFLAILEFGQTVYGY